MAAVMKIWTLLLTMGSFGGTLEGIIFSYVVVVSFHGTFVTKVDRAFRYRCFHSFKRVTSILNMNTIGTTVLHDTGPMPTCTYTIRRGSPAGPPARFAKVGDKIYHVWECDDDSHGVLVHSCWANNGRNEQFDFHDIDGCSVDPIIMADIKYEQSLTRAYVETHAFKFSDTSVLNFRCTLELCKKAQAECEGLTPPECGRGKRSAGKGSIMSRNAIAGSNDVMNSEFWSERSYEVTTFFDVLEDFQEKLGVPAKNMDILEPILPRKRSSLLLKKTCLPAGRFAFLLGTIMIMFTISTASSIMLFSKRNAIRTQN